MDKIGKLMHGVVLAALDHYFQQIFVGCSCVVCEAVKGLEEVVGTDDLELYIKVANVEIKE